jgi:hypothetical protein
MQQSRRARSRLERLLLIGNDDIRVLSDSAENMRIATERRKIRPARAGNDVADSFGTTEMSAMSCFVTPGTGSPATGFTARLRFARHCQRYPGHANA